MKKLLWTMIIFAIVIGITGIALQNMYKSESVISYLQRENINNIWIYKYDFKGYFDNIELSLKKPFLEIELPELEWDVQNPLNALKSILNILVLVGNVLLLPLRIGGLTIRTILALIGINVINPPQTPLKRLVDFSTDIINLHINYVN